VTVPDDLLVLALDVAREAGALLLDRPDQLDFGTKSTPTDVVTAMDEASEALVRRRFAEARPGDGMLGEEGTDDPGTTGVRWIVDPLDGTVNYLYRLPFWAVSIAAEVDGEVVAGVVHAPVLGWTFTATLGGGSWVEQGGRTVRLAGSPVSELSKTLLATGFGYAAERRRAQGAWIAQLLPEIRDLRRQGSGALDLCMTAWGLVDAYVEQGLSPWDLAAGQLVATEAGLVVGGLHGKPAGADLVVSAPQGIAAALFARLEELRADAAPATAPRS
jgi:myo-inositol-1(or 4)-monophosphatase